MAQNISLWGANYSAVPAVELPKTGGGTASFTDVSDTTAAAADVAQGKYFYTAAGVRTQGTSSGGGGGGTYRITLKNAGDSSLIYVAYNGEGHYQSGDYFDVAAGDPVIFHVYVGSTNAVYINGVSQTLFLHEYEWTVTSDASVLFDYSMNDHGYIRVATNGYVYNQDKTATSNGSVTADNGYDGLGTVTVSISGAAIPQGWALYNGYLLPQLPDDPGYDYYWIRANKSTGNFDLVRGTAQWTCASNASLNAWSLSFPNNTTVGAHQYSIPMDANEQSTSATDWGEVTVSYAATYGTGSDRKPIFTNEDIIIAGTSNTLLRHGFAVLPTL